MLKYAKDLNVAVAGVGAILGNQMPLVQTLLRNWPLTALAGAALAFQYRRRWKKKELDLYTAMMDAGMVLSPIVALYIIKQVGSAPTATPAAPGA
jgi:hypothetical protein